MTNAVLTRRSALRLIAAGGLAVVACQQPPPSSPPTVGSAASASKPAASQPKTGGTLRTALPSDITSLEGHLYFTWSFESTWLAFDRLIEYDDKLQPRPMLAESWDATP